MLKNTSRKTLLVAVVLIIFIIAVSGCTSNVQPENGNQTNNDQSDSTNNEETGNQLTESDIKSLDVSISKFKAGELEGGVRIRARNLDAETPDFRLDKTGGETVITYLDSESVGYLYRPEKGNWVQYSGAIATQVANSYASAVLNARSWAAKYSVGNTATVSIGDETGEVTINSVNDGFSDDLFKPPMGADVEEVSMTG